MSTYRGYTFSFLSSTFLTQAIDNLQLTIFRLEASNRLRDLPERVTILKVRSSRKVICDKAKINMNLTVLRYASEKKC